MRIQVLAGSSNYLIDIWSSDNGLPDSSVNSIAQTPDGYLWGGTFDGLARFDGVRFVTFDPVNTPELKSSRIVSLFVDNWGTLWVNTWDGSLTSVRNGVFTREWEGGKVRAAFSGDDHLFFALEGSHNQFISRSRPAEPRGEWNTNMLPANISGDNFKQDGQGTIWFFRKSLYRIVGTNVEEVLPVAGWRGSSVKCITIDRDGHLWVGTDREILQWHNGQLEDCTPTNGEPNVNVKFIFGMKDGCWVFTDDRMRHFINRRWVDEVSSKSWRDLGGSFELGLKAFWDRDDGIWFTHQGSGLFHIGANGGKDHFSTADGLPSDLASSFWQDGEGNIWVGLVRGGLVKLRNRLFHVIGPAEGISAPAVSGVCEDGQSNVWISTFSGGLYRWGNGSLEHYLLSDGANKESFYSVFPDKHNQIWLSAGREDLHLLENGKITRVDAVHGIKAILVDNQDRVWLGRPNGLTLYEKGEALNFSSTNGLVLIRSIVQDERGSIWVGADKGTLLQYTNGSFIRYQADDALKNQPVWSLLPQKGGTIWAGTFRGGLLRFQGGQFTRYTTKAGLPSDVISQILDDGKGKLWFGSSKGIFCIPQKAFEEFDSGLIQKLPVVEFGLNDGLPTLECSGGYQPTCWRGHDDRLWFATGKGLVWAKPDEWTVNREAPPVIIEDLLVDGKRQEMPLGSRPVVIGPGKHQLDIQFTALSFMSPDKVLFRYTLKGLDDEWVDAGTKRSVHFGTLPPGEYCFQVIACNNDGVWNKKGATLNLILQPYIWQTWWFQYSMVGFAAGILSLTVLMIARARARRKIERLERAHAIEKERQRIARDIHDDLGAGLTQILLQSSIASSESSGQTQTDLNQISDNTRELVRKMDEIVWAVAPEKDTLKSLALYAGKYVQEFCAASKIRCRLDLPVPLPETPVSAEVRHSLFLAVKEAVTNVAKHSQATEVMLQLKVDSNSFTFIVKDNGVGITPGKTCNPNRISSGHGLLNLAERLEKMGGNFAIVSGPAKGTEVQLNVPFNRIH